MIDIEEKIKSVAAGVLSRKKMFTRIMSERVTAELIAAITAKNAARLDKKDVESIADKLIINNNRRSLYTWLHFELFNRMVIRLRIDRVIQCPFIINTASKRRRDLIVYFDDSALNDLSLAKQVWRFMNGFHDCSDDTIVNPEVDVLSAYVASSILFSHIQFPMAYRSLLAISEYDASAGVPYINVPIDDEPVFFRHFLSFHTVSRLNRAILHFMKYPTSTAKQPTAVCEHEPLLPISFPMTNFPEVFRQWLAGVAGRMQVHTPGNPTLRSFIKGARYLAALESFTGGSANAPVVPSFLQALHSRSISAYSYPDHFLKYLIKDYPETIYSPALDRHHEIYLFKDKALEAVFIQITAVRRRAHLDANMTAKERETEIGRIPGIVEAAKASLTATAYRNLTFFSEWFVARYNAGTSLKTLNDYSSTIAGFIDTISAAGMVASQISDDDLSKVFESLREHYQSRAIKSRTKDFLEFVTSEHGSNLSTSIWQKKATSIKDVRTQGPFIGYDLIEKANSEIRRFFASRQARSRNDHFILPIFSSPSLIYRADQRRHAYCLSYFTGLRRDEVISRTVRSIRHDDGPILIIEEGKTGNAERAIPIYLLLPDDYLPDFMGFVDARRRKDGPDARLFAQEDGRAWQTKDFFENIQDLFISLGIPDYTFHDNRGSFASWFLLRWLKVFHREKLSGDEPFLMFELFQDKYDERFKQLFWGYFSSEKNPSDFTHALFVLARLLGHGGPIITLERYVHTADWIYYIFQRHTAKEGIAITPKHAANLLQMPHSSLYRLLRSRNIGKILPDDLLRLQQELLLDKD